MKEVSALVPSHLMADAKDDAKRAKNVMGKDDFMKLLMTQLQHQDPMKPMDHHEFGAQLAQFTQLEQLTNIGSGIQGLRTDRGEDSKLQAVAMIGKKVQAAGNEVELVDGQSVVLRPNIKGDAQPVKAMVYSPTGQLVRELSLNGKNISDGIQWDGKAEDGTPSPSGKYSFRVLGVDKMGQAQEIAAELSGRVTGMELKGKEPVLLVQTAGGITRLDMSKVTGVSVDEDKPAVPVTMAPAAAKPKVVAMNAEGEVEAPETPEAPESADPSEEFFGGSSHGFPQISMPMEGIRR